MPREQPQLEGANVAPILDLSVIDEAFGDFADLYSDVLRASVVATPEQIQLAYFDRRSELFTLLAKMDSRPQDDEILQQRMDAERRMDAVVLAVRILGDPDQRLEYDRLRQGRLINRRRAANGELQNAASEESTFQNEDKYAPKVSKKEKKKKKEKKANWKDSSKKKKLKKLRYQDELENTNPSMGDESTRLDSRNASIETDDNTYEMRQDDGDSTVYSLASKEQLHKAGYLSCLGNSRVFRKLTDEISGACEDTLVSVDQVFNAFTLTDKDIRAVTRRIDKVKKQLDG